MMAAGVGGVYSPARVVQGAKNAGLYANETLCLDLTTCDSDGSAWDFSNKPTRRRAVETIRKLTPRILIGSVTCMDWSAAMNINWG